MVAESIQRIVRDYLKAATQAGIPTHQAVLFGSQARGNAGESSDMNLMVLSSALEPPPHSRDLVATLWRLCLNTDARIEPLACGEKHGKPTTPASSSKSSAAKGSS